MRRIFLAFDFGLFLVWQVVTSADAQTQSWIFFSFFFAVPGSAESLTPTRAATPAAMLRRALPRVSGVVAKVLTTVSNWIPSIDFLLLS